MALTPLSPDLTSASDEEDAPLIDSPPPREASIREILTPGVAVAIANYAALSILDIARAALMPLFYASPIEAGGLGFTPKIIGLLLGGYVRNLSSPLATGI